jgi:hypothetical protein
MAESLTPTQTLLLWCLLGQGGDALQSAIMPRVKKADREALARRGLIATEKRGRSLLLRVEDKGWHWAGAHLSDSLPPNFQVLQHWLTRLGVHLEKSGETLADFVGPPVEQPAATIETKAKTPRRKAAKKAPEATRASGPLSDGALRQRIEDAYLAVTGGKKDEMVMLSDLRAKLADIDRKAVDAGLLHILQGDPKARLGQMTDPKRLTLRDREAAFSPGGELFDLLWIMS